MQEHSWCSGLYVGETVLGQLPDVTAGSTCDRTVRPMCCCFDLRQWQERLLTPLKWLNMERKHTATALMSLQPCQKANWSAHRLSQLTKQPSNDWTLSAYKLPTRAISLSTTWTESDSQVCYKVSTSSLSYTGWQPSTPRVWPQQSGTNCWLFKEGAPCTNWCVRVLCTDWVSLTHLEFLNSVASQVTDGLSLHADLLYQRVLLIFQPCTANIHTTVWH